MPAKKLLTKVERLAREKAIIQDLKAGLMSYRVIALKHKVSLPTVNAKARKAGITRSRRGPAAFKAIGKVRIAKAVRRTKAGRKPAARKAILRAGTRVTARRGRKPGRPALRTALGRRMPRGPVGRGANAFRAQFRDLVMRHYPNISLKIFDRLTNVIERALP